MLHVSPSVIEDTFLFVIQGIVDGALRTIVNLDLREVETIVLRNR